MMRASAWFRAFGLGVGLGVLAASPSVRAGEPVPQVVLVADLMKAPPVTGDSAYPARPVGLHVYTDAEGGTYVVMFAHDTRVFYGVDKKLYEQHVKALTGQLGEGYWDLGVVAPLLSEYRNGAISRRKDDGITRVCAEAPRVSLTELVGDQAKAKLAKVKLYTSALTHEAYRLARDDRGVYYYIDRLAPLYGDAGFRLFVGKRGAMKPIVLTDIARDTAGEVFNTKTGDLRLVRDTDSAGARFEWVRGEKRTKLVDVLVADNLPLIYGQLGVYSFIGTMCDNPPPAR